MLETVRKLKWEVIEHPAHSPDLVPSDFHFSGLCEGAVGGRRFRCDNIKERGTSAAACATKDYYDRIEKLV
jgi:hypothetical protein